MAYPAPPPSALRTGGFRKNGTCRRVNFPLSRRRRRRHHPPATAHPHYHIYCHTLLVHPLLSVARKPLVRPSPPPPSGGKSPVPSPAFSTTSSRQSPVSNPSPVSFRAPALSFDDGDEQAIAARSGLNEVSCQVQLYELRGTNVDEARLITQGQVCRCCLLSPHSLLSIPSPFS